MIVHPIPPFYDEKSEILILGSFPSVKSRQAQFFYGHPQNQFWRLTATLLGEEAPETIPDKKAFLHRNHLALWDVIHSCDIEGSADSTIKNVVANDLRIILDNAPIKRIFVNGRTSEKYYKKYIEKTIGIQAIYLPSTSPANAAWGLERLKEAWKIILE